ncbi:hypothetical protein LEP3755_48380 [Leptolyngbya sp. NIES-3755]|nr:hypothetical protein LEP3755_48380 [Leptolyngbya sp. NIES-3755]
MNFIDRRYPARASCRMTHEDLTLLKSIARQENTDVSSLLRRGFKLLVMEKQMLNAIVQSAAKRGQTYPLDV